MARLDLDGATAVVTGGSRGIGPHIAAALTEHGVRVALIARSRRELEAVAGDVRRAGHQAIAVAADVTSHEERGAIVETVERELGPIDVLVNNAGGDLQRRFHNLAEDDIEAVLSLNLTSAVVLSRLVLPGMLARGRGHIVNVSSMAGRTSFPHTEAYAAAKDGLIGFTRVLRGDYRALGVSASAVILGPVGGEGVGARTAQEFGLTLPRFIASPRAVARATVRAIVADRAEIAVVPGPGRTLRAVMDRFPGTGPALNRLTGTDKTMDTVAEHREQQALACAARPMIEKPPPVPS